MTKWYCCTKCKEADSYAIDSNSGTTTMPRGHFLVCGVRYNAIVTGFNSKQDADKWIMEHPFKQEEPNHEQP